MIEVSDGLAPVFAADGRKLRTWTVMDGGGNSLLLETSYGLLLVDSKWLGGAGVLGGGWLLAVAVERARHPKRFAASDWDRLKT